MQDSLRHFLQSILDDKSARYIAGFGDLDGDGKPEALVYVISQGLCGSGGCNTLVLSQVGATWKMIAEISITRLPIRLLKTTSSGWRDLGVWVQGGGIQPGYEAQLRFDGGTYPRNPSVPPAVPLANSVQGEVIVSTSEKPTLLYPLDRRSRGNGR